MTIRKSGIIRAGVALSTAVLISAAAPHARAQMTNTNGAPIWVSKPLSLTESLGLAVQQNGDILRGRSDLEAQYGVVVQLRSTAIPKVRISGNYQATSETEQFPFPNPPPVQDQSWAAGIEVAQAIYQGGQIRSSLRAAKLTREQALLAYQTVIADALLRVRVSYYDVLSTAEQIAVHEASVKLLTQELDDQTRRFQAGTVPRFNVLRAEVELANERPQLIRARNLNRIAKNLLVNLLGYHVAQEIGQDIPLELIDKLDADPYSIELPVAIQMAMQNRTELAVLRKQELLRKEDVIFAKGGYKPTVEVFGGYGARNTSFNNDLGQVVDGATGGARLVWNIFDGQLTRGRVEQAQAQYDGAKVDVDNQVREIELNVRTQYSQFIEATEVLESQKKVQEQAEETLRLAAARSSAGTGTQLDVLSAQTSLTEARSTQVQALHDYDVARARLERAMGINVKQSEAK
jgi:outer membrane protein TolC